MEEMQSEVDRLPREDGEGEFSESRRGETSSSGTGLLKNDSGPQRGDRSDSQAKHFVLGHRHSTHSQTYNSDSIIGVPRDVAKEMMRTLSKVLIKSLQSQSRVETSVGPDEELGLLRALKHCELAVRSEYFGPFRNAGYCNDSVSVENLRQLRFFNMDRPSLGPANNYGLPAEQTPWFGGRVEIMSGEEIEKEDAI